jgi:uncharacterized oxidoreductase
LGSVPSFLIKHEELRDLARRALVATGSDAGEATIVADHLVEANLAGHDSHGIGLLPMYLGDRRSGMIKANRHATLEVDGGVFGGFTGEMGYGQVVVGEAFAWGIEKAKAGGTAIVTVREAYHIGRVGAYAEQAAAAGLVSVIFVNVVGGSPVVAPFAGTDARLQTNPIAIGVPGEDGTAAMVLDFATSRMPVGKIRVAAAEGRPVPPGTLIDATGAPTQDPRTFFRTPRASLLPFGEHKGYGLSLMCEVLGGAMSRSRSNRQTGSTGRMTNGVFAIVLDPARFGTGSFHEEVAAIVAHVKASRPASPGVPVMVPGEPERKARAVRNTAGVPIDEESWRQITAAAVAVGVG